MRIPCQAKGTRRADRAADRRNNWSEEMPLLWIPEWLVARAYASHINISDAIEDSSRSFFLTEQCAFVLTWNNGRRGFRPNYQPVVERPMRGALLCLVQCFFSCSWHKLHLLSKRDGKGTGTKRWRRRKRKG